MHLHVTQINNGPLTDAERDVLQQLCLGKLRKQIAYALHRSYGTVSKQVESIARKLSAHSHAEIVAKAVAMGLVEITIKALLIALSVQCCFLDDDALRSKTRLRTSRHHCAHGKKLEDI